MWIVPWDPFLMKKLIKSVICGSRTLFTGPTELIKTLKSQQLPATVHMNSSHCSLNECAAAGKKKKKVKERKRKRKKLDPNPAIISEHPTTLISTWIASVVIYVILNLNSVVNVDCNSFALDCRSVQCSLILGIQDWWKLRMLWV